MTVKVAFPWEFVVDDPVLAGVITEWPVPWARVTTLPTTGWGAPAWSSSVTVIVEDPPDAAVVGLAAIDELAAVTVGAANVIFGCVLSWRSLSVVSVTV